MCCDTTGRVQIKLVQHVGQNCTLSYLFIDIGKHIISQLVGFWRDIDTPNISLWNIRYLLSTVHSNMIWFSENTIYIWFKYDLGQKYYAPQVQPHQGSNSWPPDHDSTLHVTETPTQTTWPSVTLFMRLQADHLMNDHLTFSILSCYSDVTILH